jgi:TolA-binding protein
MRSRLREMRDSASAWKALYRSIKEERDLLAHRVQSKDCQKVICYQTQLEAAEEEIERLTKLNETYKRQIEIGKKKKAAAGSAIAEGC